MEEKSTIERMKESYQGRLNDTNILMELSAIEDDAPHVHEELIDKYGELMDYALCCDFADYSEHEGPTDDPTERFFRLQFSWGGPSEELRVYADGRIEFWFLDWGVGEHCDGSEFEDYIYAVTGLSVDEIAQKVDEFNRTGEMPTLY